MEKRDEELIDQLLAAPGNDDLRQLMKDHGNSRRSCWNSTSGSIFPIRSRWNENACRS